MRARGNKGAATRGRKEEKKKEERGKGGRGEKRNWSTRKRKKRGCEASYGSARKRARKKKKAHGETEGEATLSGKDGNGAFQHKKRRSKKELGKKKAHVGTERGLRRATNAS